MSNNITIGEAAVVRDIVQPSKGDFRWPLQFLTGQDGNTPLDVSADDFEFTIYDTDETTVIMTLEVGTGITRTNSSTIQIDLPLEDYADLTVGCKYKYLLRQTVGSFRKPLFTGKFMLIK